MQRILAATIAMVSLSVVAPASADTFTGTGRVVSLNSLDDVIFSGNEDWAAVEGFSSAGVCGKSGGLVVLKVRDTARGARQFSLLMAALLAGHQVQVTVDDAYRDGSSFCYLRTVKLARP